MPRELVATDVRTPGLRDYDDKPLEPGQIRVRTEYGAPKHGTELHLYRGDRGADTHFDPELRAYVPGSGTGARFPITLGNIAVGVVTEIGPGVEGVAVGDRVSGYGGLRETQTWAWGAPGVYPGVRPLPEGMSWQDAVCADPAQVALGGVRDGGVRVGDRVAVFGLGAIGQMAVQIAKVAGAEFVVAVDPIAARREVAAGAGADLVLDPTACDAGLEIRMAAGRAGVDVAIETSGSSPAVHHAVRGLAFGGTVAVLAVHKPATSALDLGREAHLNRPRFVFPRIESEPHYDHPRWNGRRMADAAWALLASGRLCCEPIVQPVVGFDDAADAYREYVDEHPERSVKLGVRFGGAP